MRSPTGFVGQYTDTPAFAAPAAATDNGPEYTALDVNAASAPAMYNGGINGQNPAPYSRGQLAAAIVGGTILGTILVGLPVAAGVLVALNGGGVAGTVTAVVGTIAVEAVCCAGLACG